MVRLLPLVLLLACQAHEERTVSYDERHGDSTTMDLYLPGGGGTARPAIFFVHGGGWRLFSKRQFQSQARRFARSGYVTASINYRLVPEGRFPNAAWDTACALAWFQNHAVELGVDPDRIVLMGYSAGGHLAGLVATTIGHPELAPDCAEGAPGPVAGVISGAGPMDMRGLRQGDVVHEFMGGSPDELPELYDLASPITHASPDDPPFLFVHGRSDLFVPNRQSRNMRDLLRAEGVEAEYLQLHGTGHVLNPTDDAAALGVALSTDSPEARTAILDFLDRHVGRP